MGWHLFIVDFTMFVYMIYIYIYMCVCVCIYILYNVTYMTYKPVCEVCVYLPKMGKCYKDILNIL